MRQRRVVVVGAGVARSGGRARTGSARTGRHRAGARHAGRAARCAQVAVGPAPDRLPVRPCSPCAGCSRRCSPRPAQRSPTMFACARSTSWRATPGTSAPGSICLPRQNARPTRSADFAGAAEADGYRGSARGHASASTTRSNGRSSARCAAEPGRPDRRRRPSRAVRPAGSIKPFALDVVGARALLSAIRGCASCSAATPPIAAPRPSWRPRP